MSQAVLEGESKVLMPVALGVVPEGLPSLSREGLIFSPRFFTFPSADKVEAAAPTHEFGKATTSPFGLHFCSKRENRDAKLFLDLRGGYFDHARQVYAHPNHLNTEESGTASSDALALLTLKEVDTVTDGVITVDETWTQDT